MSRLTVLRAAPALLAIGVLLPLPDAASARPGRDHRTPPMVYTSPANILRGQLALERLGHLERGRYTPGETDPPTREALRDFQRDHTLRSTGSLDQETFALLPIDGRPDQDDDGIPDGEDRCPSTPKGKGIRVGHDGCPFAPEGPSG